MDKEECGGGQAGASGGGKQGLEWAEESEMLSCQKVFSGFSLRFFFYV